MSTSFAIRTIRMCMWASKNSIKVIIWYGSNSVQKNSSNRYLYSKTKKINLQNSIKNSQVGNNNFTNQKTSLKKIFQCILLWWTTDSTNIKANFRARTLTFFCKILQIFRNKSAYLSQYGHILICDVFVADMRIVTED